MERLSLVGEWNNSTVMVRAFLALELDREIRARLEVPLEALRTSSARMTFVEPQNIHITMKFLGDVDERTLPRVMDAVRRVPFTPFVVTVGSVTVNNPKRPFTVWCTMGDSGKANELFHTLEDALAPLGFAKETRQFTPHATLARIRDPDPSLFFVLKTLEGKTYGECTVSGIKLKKSTLMPRGPVYEDLLEVKW
ncbi:MAG TPA: RNA 2',3'-cyclic phosphodiesterase [Methanoregula sp.]|nr:RNA 2',3'-cyclic phosphodiesterase [Methanoregula sp.]